MATKSYSNIDKPIQLVVIAQDNGDGTASTDVGGSAVTDGLGTDVTGSITTPTGTITSNAADGFSTVTFSAKGTYAGWTAVFEQSDDGGTSWFPVDADRVGTGVVEDGATLLTNASVMWRSAINGSDSFRIRSTALASGTVSIIMSFTGMPTAAGVGVVANFADNHPLGGTVTIQDTGSVRTSGQNGAVQITGTPTASSFFGIALNGYSHMRGQVTGTWTGTLEFEGSIDNGTTWTPFSIHVESTAYTQSQITGNCNFRGSTGAFSNVRLSGVAAMTGTASVLLAFASADTVVTLTNGARIIDNTNGNALAIKSASTAAVATDQAVVVTISPNGQLAAGRATAVASVPVVLSTEDRAGDYETIAASQTAQVMGGTGAIGDYIKRLIVIPTTVSPGVVTLLDNATSIPLFAGGAASLAMLAPFAIELGMVSVSGAWKITTGAGLSLIAMGKFT